MTNHPTKYESYQTNTLRGVVFTMYNYIKMHESIISPITPKNKLLNQNGGVIWSTEHHDQSSYTI